MTEKKPRKRKNNKNNILSDGAAPADMQRLREVARKILGYLEHTIEHADVLLADATPQQKNDLLFAGKNSLVGALLALSELMLRLEDAGSARAGQEVQRDSVPISESDMQLLQHFLTRQQSALPADE